MPRSPIPAMVNQFNTLTEVEQKVFLDLVDPRPEPETPAKQTRKKRGRSPRAQSISSVIQGTAKHDTPQANGPLCTAKVPGLDVECGEPEDALVHDPNGGYGGYHVFESPKVKKASGK